MRFDLCRERIRIEPERAYKSLAKCGPIDVRVGNAVRVVIADSTIELAANLYG